MSDQIRQLERLLDVSPVVFEGEPFLLAELENIEVIQDIYQYAYQIDSLEEIPIQRTILLGPASKFFDRWPIYEIASRIPPDIPTFNRNLFSNIVDISKYCFTQSQIVERIIEDTDVDIIVLLLFDGLSFCDWVEFPGIESCLVEGPTITPVGFRNVIGSPTIAEKLYDKGFHKRMGFSHWDRSNDLADLFFYGFDPSSQMYKVSEFDEILLKIEDNLSSDRTYIQILTNGLDSVCHRHRGRPPIAMLSRHLYENVVMSLAEKVRSLGVIAIIYVSADHGILWKPEPNSGMNLITLKDERARAQRYHRGSIVTPHSRLMSSFGRTYTVLQYPFLFNSLSSIEWGTHGGISLQESVVPFLKLEVY